MVETICAFVRTHATAPGTPGNEFPSTTVNMEAVDVIPPQHKQLTYVQAAFKVLGRMGLGWGVDLSDAALCGVVGAGLEFVRADFNRANLRHANLCEAYMIYTELVYANLSDTILERANAWPGTTPTRVASSIERNLARSSSGALVRGSRSVAIPTPSLSAVGDGF